MTYVGGLRARLVRDSVYRTIEKGLRDLGWFTSHASRSPVQLLPEPVALDREVPRNTLALGDEIDDETALELGSGLSEFRWSMFLDVYAENDSIALHLVGDVAAIMGGRMPSIGRSAPVVDVWDYTLATPVAIFRVEVENVRTAKAHDFPQPWLRFWRSCTFQVVDAYTDEDVADLVPPFEGYGGY